jgi:chromosome segregation ATPase
MSRLKSSSPAPQPDLLDRDEPGLSQEEIGRKVQMASEQLLDLKRQQEELERQRQELEELKRKQHEFQEGRSEMSEALTRGLQILQGHQFNLQKEIEQIRLIYGQFEIQLNEISEIHDEAWSQHDLPSELTRALAKLEQARIVHNQARARIEALRENSFSDDDGGAYSESSRSSGGSFGSMVKAGFAYSLPLLILGLIFFIAFVLKR